MVKKKTKLSKKANQRIKTIVLATGLLICCCIVITLLFTLNRSVYKIDSRVNEIKKEQKKDIDGHKTIAWLKVQGTTIDAPIVGYESNSAFQMIDKENFLWNTVNEEKLYNQVNVSGHNILNLSKQPKIGMAYFSRFDDLMAFVYEDFAKENQYIQYTINGKDYLYKIFGVFFEKEYKLDIYHNGDYTEKEMKNYLKQIKDSSFYDYDVDVDEKDKIITLSTCTRFFEGTTKQFVVVGRMVREKEKIKNYGVKANAKYKEIKEIMKGDDNDEKTEV